LLTLGSKTSWMNSRSWEAHVPKTVRVIELAIVGVKAEAVVWHKAHLVPASTKAASYKWMENNF